MRIVNGYLAFFVFILFTAVGFQFFSMNVMKEYILMFYSSIGATLMFTILHFSLRCKQ